MRNKIVFITLISVFLIASNIIFAQGETTKKKAQLAVGVALSVSDQKIILQTKSGTMDAVLTSKTQYFRLPPDNIKISAATGSKLADISNGDRVLVTGTLSESNNKSIFAIKVYLVKGADIAQQQAKQRADWQKRGISGRVKEVDATTKIITVEMRGITGAATTLKVTPKDQVKFLRYSSESVKYSDAVNSKFSDIQKDDMIQALGDKTEDGTTLKAEEILTGAFVTVAGKVKSVDAEKNEVTIEDLKTKKDVTISVKSNSLMKKFPEETAQRMARFMAFMARGGGGGAARPPRGQGRAGGNGQGRRGGGMGRMDINQMLNRFPTIKVSDLKKGEMVAVSSPKLKDPSRLRAIKLLAGVEPFITMAAMSNRRSGGRRGVAGSLNIPGLDSVQF